MEDNSTVVQLKNALNQLLNAYESLKVETEELKADNSKMREDLESLEGVNTGLNDKLSSLNDTTDHHSVEMGEMLDRIESILGSEEEEVKESEDENNLFPSVSEDLSEDENSIENTEEENQTLEEQYPQDDKYNSEDSQTNIPFNNNNSTKDIDLGRMQSLLNGFNN